MYNYYLNNLKILIKDYNLKYYWINLNDCSFFEATKITTAKDWNSINDNYFLNLYKNNKIKLGEDILQKNGMYTPFFFFNINNKKIVVVGKHRLYSLLLNNKIKKISNNFLFIEFPNVDLIFNKKSRPLQLWHANKTEFYPKNGWDIYDFIITISDQLGLYLSCLEENEINPPDYFLNKESFEKFLYGDENN